MFHQPTSSRRTLAALWLGGLAIVGATGCAAMPARLTDWLRPGDAPVGAVAPQSNAAIVSDSGDAPLRPNAKLRELSPAESAEVCAATAREMEAHGKELAAIEQYERARSFDRRRKGIAPRLAVLYDRQGNHERASAEYATALREEPKNADLWNDFAYFQFEREAYDEAEQAARRAVALDADHKRAWVNLGLILAERQRYDEAYESFTRAVSPAAAHNNLGIILARQGNAAEAREHLAEAHRIDPTLRQPHAVLAYLNESEQDASEVAATDEAPPAAVAATAEKTSHRRPKAQEAEAEHVERR